jgi:hypothetical protein
VNESKGPVGVSIWWFAFGYFACYAPYSSLTKAFSDGLLSGSAGPIAGFVLLPVSALASLIGMFVFISAMGWWKYAGRRRILGRDVPFPGIWTFLSGLATAAIIPTTTLAYTFTGVSIIFMMLLMRGGVLVLAPIVDFVSGRKVRWFSWVALLLALGALFVGFSGHRGDGAPMGGLGAAVAYFNVAIYLGAYFVRLRFMSRLAKSSDLNARTRYFVEEQMTATPALVVFLLVFAFLGSGPRSAELAEGFTRFFAAPGLLLAIAIGIGVLSQGTGIFGGLILLDRRENTFCVPVNRASSVLAGLVATWALWGFAGSKAPPDSELVGAILLIVAIAVLSIPELIAKKKAGATGG